MYAGMLKEKKKEKESSSRSKKVKPQANKNADAIPYGCHSTLCFGSKYSTKGEYQDNSPKALKKPPPKRSKRKKKTNRKGRRVSQMSTYVCDETRRNETRRVW